MRLSTKGKACILGSSLLLLTSCMAMPSKTAYEACPVKSEEWRFLPQPPANESEIITAAAPELSDKKGMRTFWFQANQSDDLLMCRSPYPKANFCGGNCFSSTTHFYKKEGIWKHANDDVIVVCGCP